MNEGDILPASKLLILAGSQQPLVHGLSAVFYWEHWAYLTPTLARALPVPGNLAWTSSICPCFFLRGDLDGDDHPAGRRVNWVDALSSTWEMHRELSSKL